MRESHSKKREIHTALFHLRSPFQRAPPQFHCITHPKNPQSSFLACVRPDL